MAAEENLDIDLPAAALRADGADLEISIEVLATSLEQALPGIASVERRKVGGFRSKRREVRRIAVALGDEQFELLPRRPAHPVHAPQGRARHHAEPPGATDGRLDRGARSTASRAAAEVTERDRIALEGLLR